MVFEPDITEQAHFSDYLDGIAHEFNQLTQQLDTLQATTENLEQRLKITENTLTRDSVKLTDLLVTTVFSDKITVPVTSTHNTAVFDSSQQARDADGTPIYPHYFYLVSAFTPASGRVVVVDADVAVAGEIKVCIVATGATAPARVDRHIRIVNPGSQVIVHVRVLKVLGIR